MVDSEEISYLYKIIYRQVVNASEIYRQNIPVDLERKLDAIITSSQAREYIGILQQEGLGACEKVLQKDHPEIDFKQHHILQLGMYIMNRAKQDKS